MLAGLLQFEGQLLVEDGVGGGEGGDLGVEGQDAVVEGVDLEVLFDFDGGGQTQAVEDGVYELVQVGEGLQFGQALGGLLFGEVVGDVDYLLYGGAQLLLR